MSPRPTLILWSALLAGVVSGSCTPTSVLPPTASLSPPAAAAHPGNLGRRSPAAGGLTASLPSGGANPWKPTAAARDWQHIVIHHTATDSGSVETIHDTHLKNKDKSGNPWLGIGYHFVIGNGQGMTDGAIEPTFRWRTQIQGAHAGSSNKDYNERGIGVCLVGNFEKVPPSPAQLRSVRLLVQTLKREYRIPATAVVGHKDIRASATECPGKLFPMSDLAFDEPVWLLGLDGNGVPVEQVANVPGSTLQ